MSATLSPQLPHAKASLSYWHRTTRAFPLLNQNDTIPPPLHSTYVVIGAGLTGALTAFSLIEAGIEGSEILLIEAREVVSGSTGRNAGHCRPDGFRNFNAYAAQHGAEQALKIANLEDENFILARNFIEKHGIACDFVATKTLDVCLSAETAADEANNLQEYISAGGKTGSVREYKGDEARKKTGFDGAIAAYEWDAAFLHPVKLTQWIIKSAVARGVRLWTHCPVIRSSKGENNTWHLQTSRGSIECCRVIHCTNAYAGSLLPQLSIQDLVPIRAQGHALVPSRAQSGNRNIKTSLALRTSLQSFYSVIQSVNDGMIIFTVGRPTGMTFDESGYDEEVAKEVQEKLLEYFQTNVKSEVLAGEGLDHAWSGLLAFTPDKVPHIGEIPELPGQFICAGFNGHGMSNIFAVVAGLVQLVRGRPWSDTGMPECMRYNASRLKSGN